MIFKALVRQWQAFRTFMKSSHNHQTFTPVYRLVEIAQNDEGDYIVTIQIINKSVIFKARPEELLANDDSVDLFSPRDIRTLTYLGYLGINAPKYKVLAKRLLENDNQLVFLLKKKGEKHIIAKTAAEISKESDLLKSLDAKDAQMIGYAAAAEHFHVEQQQKTALIAEARGTIDQG